MIHQELGKANNLLYFFMGIEINLVNLSSAALLTVELHTCAKLDAMYLQCVSSLYIYIHM